MGKINEKAFIEELVFCLNEGDLVKAKALLQFASDTDVDAVVQKRAMLELAKGPEKVVFPLLEYLTKIEIQNSEVQESLYELILDKSFGNTELVKSYILENDRKTRLIFLKAAGDLLLSDTAPVLTQIISTETDAQIRVEAIRSLGKFRFEESLPVLTGMAGQADFDVVQAAIYAVMEHGGQKATDQLLEFIGDDEQINKLIVEAIAEIQDFYALEKLTELLGSSITNVRDTAIDQLIKLGGKATPILTKAFQNAKSDYMVHLVTTLGYIGDPAALTPVLDIINTQPKDANIRQAAYEAMERIPSTKTAISLVQGLQDPVEAVRMSAARAIDRNLSKVLVAGLKNVVRQGSQDSMNAVGALIDADAGNIFNFLVEEEAFVDLAGDHIQTRADIQTRDAFVRHMKRIGQDQFAAKLVQEQVKSPEDKPARIVVVDDSKMMLKLYQNKLTTIGYHPDTFSRPEDAIPDIINTRPDLVITDLNMPNISGLELTREIRRRYDRSDVPILMITTQSDFVEKDDGDQQIDNSVITKTGINKILHKPFTDDEFKDAIQSFLT